MRTLTGRGRAGRRPSAGTHRIARTAAALLPHEWRAARVLPLFAGAGAGTAVCAVPVVLATPLELAPAVLLTHFAAVLGALGTAFVIDDPAAATTSCCPSPQWLRRLLRVTGALVVLAAARALQILLVRGALPPGPGPALPYGDLAVESAALALLVIVFALLGLRSAGGPGGGTLAAAGPAAAVMVLLLLPPEAEFFGPPEDAVRWEAASARWLGLLLVLLPAAVLLLFRRPSGRR
ncbi:hypothetical protein [Streptomyces sp. CAU 1734]|uniref:hypothetical protein n=1 Tax=Streptomyces sp. CAU 1734 TaxID=3140360 RepID=UPI00326005B9